MSFFFNGIELRIKSTYYCVPIADNFQEKKTLEIETSHKVLF
jgi:hypothetical protein